MKDLDFINKEDFQKHILETIGHYGEALTPYDLKKFNGNIIDPIKLVFDKSIYRCSWEEIVRNEISRQRDKSNNNAIGYFHQHIFKYMKDCKVPQAGWDVIFTRPSILPDCGQVSRIYVEMKNKHNTMNSASSQKTYMKMQGQLLKDDDCACLLVEAIAKRSQNITWEVTVDGTKQRHRKIRRVSMDEFYALVTGVKDAFYQLCLCLPEMIDEALLQADKIVVPKDTVMQELQGNAEGKSMVMALYMLGFSSYCGFAGEAGRK